MKAVVERDRSAPMAVEEIRDAGAGAGEVLVRVDGAASATPTCTSSKAEVRFPTPCVLGHEVSGTVVAHGPGLSATDADGWRSATGGRRVHHAVRHLLLLRARPGRPLRDVLHVNRLKGTLYDGDTRLLRRGRLAGLDVLDGRPGRVRRDPGTGAAPMPDDLPFDVGDPGMCRLHGVRRGPRRRPTGWRVGGRRRDGRRRLNVIQVAGAFGAYPVVAIDVRDDKLDAALGLGATHAINGAEEDAGAGFGSSRRWWRRGVRGARAAGDVRAGDQHRPRRRASVMVGIAPAGRTAPVEITRLVRRKIQICGSFGGRPRQDLAHLGRLVADGLLDPGALITPEVPPRGGRPRLPAAERGQDRRTRPHQAVAATIDTGTRPRKR